METISHVTKWVKIYAELVLRQWIFKIHCFILQLLSTKNHIDLQATSNHCPQSQPRQWAEQIRDQTMKEKGDERWTIGLANRSGLYQSELNPAQFFLNYTSWLEPDPNYYFWLNCIQIRGKNLCWADWPKLARIIPYWNKIRVIRVAMNLTKSWISTHIQKFELDSGYQINMVDFSRSTARRKRLDGPVDERSLADKEEVRKMRDTR